MFCLPAQETVGISKEFYGKIAKCEVNNFEMK